MTTSLRRHLARRLVPRALAWVQEAAGQGVRAFTPPARCRCSPRMRRAGVRHSTHALQLRSTRTAKRRRSRTPAERVEYVKGNMQTAEVEEGSRDVFRRWRSVGASGRSRRRRRGCVTEHGGRRVRRTRRMAAGRSPPCRRHAAARSGSVATAAPRRAHRARERPRRPWTPRSSSRTVARARSWPTQGRKARRPRGRSPHAPATPPGKRDAQAQAGERATA